MPRRGTAVWFSGLLLIPLYSQKRKFRNIDVAPCSLHGQLLYAWDSGCSHVLNLARQDRRFGKCGHPLSRTSWGSSNLAMMKPAS